MEASKVGRELEKRFRLRSISDPWVLVHQHTNPFGMTVELEDVDRTLVRAVVDLCRGPKLFMRLTAVFSEVVALEQVAEMIQSLEDNNFAMVAVQIAEHDWLPSGAE